jgi:hypothetical protein
MKAAIGEMELDQCLEQPVVGLGDPGYRSNGYPGLRSGNAMSQSGGARSTIITSGRPLSCAAFQAWNSSSSFVRSGLLDQATARPARRSFGQEGFGPSGADR